MKTVIKVGEKVIWLMKNEGKPAGNDSEESTSDTEDSFKVSSYLIFFFYSLTAPIKMEEGITQPVLLTYFVFGRLKTAEYENGPLNLGKH